MDETDVKAAARLRSAREKAGFKSAAAASRSHGWGEAAYRHHENGTRSFGFDQALLYASAFKVTASWLIFGPPKASDSARVPIASFYVKIFADNVGEGSAMWELIDDMHVKLGLTMFPELSIDDVKIEWLIGPDGLPPMHFVNPAEIDVDPENVTGGYVFAFRVKRRFPARRFSLGDLVLVDSSVEAVGDSPSFYLYRDQDGPIIHTAMSTDEGDAVLLPSTNGQTAVSVASLEPIGLLGRVVWVAQRA